jgi:Uma2 family endonuclease
MAVAQHVSEQEYQNFVRSHPDGLWELHDGQLVRKPGMSFEHGEIAVMLAHSLLLQLDRSLFRVRLNDGRVRRPSDTVFIPDVMVFPTRDAAEFRGRPGTLPTFAEPLPLVVEVWSPSTGSYDVDAKIPISKRRGDLEIWRIHPYERTLTRWVRQPDGSYAELVHRGGLISPMALPSVTIDLDVLFDT